MQLFFDKSIWTMLHGIVFGGGAMLALIGALVAFYLLGREPARIPTASEARFTTQLAALSAVLTWLSTLVGIYIVFPYYRAAPPEGATDLTAYPRAFVMSSPETAWLHTYAMESKEHVPLIASILATAVAYVAWRYGRKAIADPRLRRGSIAVLAIAFVLVTYVSLLGIFVNKVAPVE